MSWDVYITEKSPFQVPMHQEGGTYVLGGTTNAELNITYNYSEFFDNTLTSKDGLWGLNGMTVKEVLPILEVAIAQLGVDEDPDYWKATEGNARKALLTLAQWCELVHQQGKEEDTILEIY